MAAPHLGPCVLEVGAGTGTMTQCLVDRRRVVALELEPEYVDALHRRFAPNRNVEIIEGSATNAELLGRAADSRIDSAMSFNVLEHIPEDVEVLRAVHSVLPIGGRFFCFVPAFPWLYGAMDQALGHVRRYTKYELITKMRSVGLRVVDARYVHLPGFFLWFLNGRVVRSPGVAGGKRSVLMYDRIAVPVIRRLEGRWRPPFGQSLLVVGERR
jgi:phospholipid N-methyltransferase